VNFRQKLSILRKVINVQNILKAKKMAKDIMINFMPPGMLDFGVVDDGEGVETTGYGQMPLTSAKRC